MGNNIARIVAVRLPHAENPFSTRISGLLLAKLDASGRTFAEIDIHQLVHTAERRRIFRRGQSSTHAKSIDLRPAREQVRDHEFVKFAAGENARVGEVGLIEATTHLPRQFDQIATVQTNTPGAQASMNDRLNGSERVIGINQQHRVIRKQAFEAAETFFLVAVGHDE